MVTVESCADRRDGVTLVTALISADGTPVRVGLRSRLDGPVWPPRRQGLPEEGWDGDRFEGVVPAEGHLTVGFASPAAPVEPPVEVTNAEPANPSDERMDSPAAILRGLGDPSPPSSVGTGPSTPVVGNGERAASDDGARSMPDGATSRGVDADAGIPHADDTPGTVERGTASESTDESFRSDSPAASIASETRDSATATVRPSDPAATLPAPVEEWLATVERRVERGEALQATASVSAATEALAACGGIDGARTVDWDLVTDERRLRTLERRVTALAERAERTDVAIDALEELS